MVVTGGLGQLGRCFCLALLRHGARVAIFDVVVEDAAAERRFGVPLPPGVSLHRVDVCDRSSLECGLAAVLAREGPVSGLVNAAALDSPPDAPAAENGPFESYPEASWDRVLEVNLKGVFLACQVIGGHMAEGGFGSIVNIGSIYGIVAPDQRLYDYREESFFKPVAYSASKSGLLNLTRYLATYWAALGVRVNCMTLGGVFNHQDEEFVRRYSGRVPLGRMAREDEYDGALVFLLSAASSYMTGANLVLDGGWTAW